MATSQPFFKKAECRKISPEESILRIEFSLFGKRFSELDQVGEICRRISDEMQKLLKPNSTHDLKDEARRA